MQNARFPGTKPETARAQTGMEAGHPVMKPHFVFWLVFAVVVALGHGAVAADKAPAQVKSEQMRPAAKKEPAKPGPAKTEPAKTAPQAIPGPVAPKPEGEDDGAADKNDKEGAPKTSGLPIPRFASLRTDAVNLRTGPGTRYPTDWLFVRRGLPVEIIGEFDTWRRVRDPSGTEGWVHQSTLSGRRTGVIVNGPSLLRRDVNDQAQLVATLKTGVLVNVQRCPVDVNFCRVEVKGLQGWLKREQVWGVYPNEAVQ